ncbi:Cytoplasmic tRNA 2-thiolation protein 2 [Boothiomyces sp. JEL0866]|nr:Cytoplasmic tRNA 2-thiolation protein 2 [Boothiomyces sp. JEL0866]
MCDVQEEMIPKPRNNRSLKEGFCYKCKTEKPDLHVRNSDFCKSCFLDSTIHRFRNNLMKIQKGNVLVALSGGPSSMCLLDLMSNFNSVDPVNKRQPKYPNVHVCHIDISSVVPQIEPELVLKLKEEVERRNFHFTSAKVEELFADTCTVELEDEKAILKNHSNDESLDMRLKKSLNSVSSFSAREDLLNIYIKKSIINQAIANNCNIILFGDNSTLLAIKTIALSAKGRGVVLADEIALEHVIKVTGTTISLVKPLRDVLGKEVAFYNQFKGLDPFNNANLTTGLKKDCSIDRMTSDFIIGLDEEFPSTVSTITRTAFKIKAKEHSNLACCLCDAPLDELSKFSEIMEEESNPQSWEESNPQSWEESNPQSWEESNPQPWEESKLPINSVLCYACRNISRDFKKTLEKNNTTGILPQYVSRAAMKKEIQEYLIE